MFHEEVRNGTRLVYDRERLDRIRDGGGLPVVTLDATAGLDAFERVGGSGLGVLLRCSRETAERRLQRGSSAADRARLRAWDRTAKQLDRVAGRFPLAVDTDRVAPPAVAQLVHLVVQTTSSARDGSATSG
ncbi:hypothetical protein [Pseudonocardia nigra]|uniref:hypothetical protein n=1 Tax=Pseudonocardia nigra TaxID=1921578 RepID=UPI001C5CD734|nr:hypothetical protein [Pseudonocardia nigra]